MRRLLIFWLPALALGLAGCGSVGAPGQTPRPATPSQVATADGASAALSPLPSPTGSPSPAESASSQHVLRPGTRGQAVRLLQRRLAALKYYPGQVDGRFGS